MTVFSSLARGGISKIINMHYVYLLKLNNNNSTQKYYFGLTSDLKNRFKEHQKGKSEFTKKYLPVKLIYFEGYSDVELAKEREKKIKQFGSSYNGLLKRLGLK